MTFKQPGHRSRHEKICAKKEINILKKNQEIEKIKTTYSEQISNLEQKNQIYERMINELKKQVDCVTQLAICKPTTINNTVNNVLNYAENYYKEANALKPIGDYALIMLKNGYTYDENARKVLILDGLITDDEDINILSEKDNEDFVQNLMAYKRMKTIHNTLGNFIIENYVKKDKSKQSIHLTDSSRMKFIFTTLKDSIKDKINNNEIEWKNDPKGVNITTIIIDPMLKYIACQVRLYQKDLAQKFIDNPGDVDVNEINEMQALQDLMNMCTKHNKRDKDYELRKQILEYIAPHFQFNKKLLLSK